MGFVKTLQEIMSYNRPTADFYGAENAHNSLGNQTRDCRKIAAASVEACESASCNGICRQLSKH